MGGEELKGSVLKNSKLLFTLTWPILIETFFRMLLGNINVLMLSGYSDKAVAAVGVSNRIISMVLVIYGIVASGTAININQNLGANKRETASALASAAITINLFFGLAVSALLLFGSDIILRAMNLSGETLHYAKQYFLIVGGASCLSALSATLTAIARSFQHTKLPMLVTLGMNTVNLFGNWLVLRKPFSFPSFGVQGVAVTNVISQLIGVIVMFMVIIRIKEIGMRWKQLTSLTLQMFKQITFVGVPSAGEYLSYTTAQLAVIYIVTCIGSQALTTQVYLFNVNFFTYIISLSIGQSTQILVGHQVGAGSFMEANDQCFRSLRIAVLANSGIAILFFLFRRSIFGLYTKDIYILELAMSLMLVELFLEPGRAFNHVLMSALRGAGDLRIPVVAAIISSWLVGVGLAYFLGLYLKMGLIGVWIAYACDEWCRGIVMLVFWKSMRWKTKAIVTTESI